MQNTEPLNFQANKENGPFLTELITWWERRRIFYSLSLVSTIGIAFLILREEMDVITFLILWAQTEFFGLEHVILVSLLYLFAANLFYTFGWVLHILWQYWFGSPLSGPSVFSRYRKGLFILGMIGSVVPTTFCVWVELVFFFQELP